MRTRAKCYVNYTNMSLVVSGPLWRNIGTILAQSFLLNNSNREDGFEDHRRYLANMLFANF